MGKLEYLVLGMISLVICIFLTMAILEGRAQGACARRCPAGTSSVVVGLWLDKCECTVLVKAAVGGADCNCDRLPRAFQRGPDVLLAGLGMPNCTNDNDCPCWETQLAGA